MKLYIYLFITLLILGACGNDDKTQDEEKQPKQFFGNVEGSITDQTTGDLLNNAYVLLIPSGKATPTGSDGRFVFIDLKTGTYTLQVFKEDYAVSSFPIEIEADKTMQANIRIVKSTGNLSISKAYLDFSLGNIQNFTITNHGTGDVRWQVQTNHPWVTIEPNDSILNTEASQAINIRIDRNNTQGENYALLSVTGFDGFASTILLTIGANGNGGSIGYMQVGNFLVQTQDATGLLVNWGSACYYCEHSNISGEWRLPTHDELWQLYNNKTVIGGFKDEVYWGDGFSEYSTTASTLNFGKIHGFQPNESSYKMNTYRVRCVRTLP